MLCEINTVCAIWRIVSNFLLFGKTVIPVWTTKPAVAQDLRQYVRQTFRCQAHGFTETNPAEAMDGALGAIPAGKRYRSLPCQEVTAALDTVEASGASDAGQGGEYRHGLSLKGKGLAESQQDRERHC